MIVEKWGKNVKIGEKQQIVLVTFASLNSRSKLSIYWNANKEVFSNL